MRISRALYDELVALAEASPRAEICGMVAGGDGLATRLVPVRNAAPDPSVTYMMDPNDQHRAWSSIEDSGEDLLAIYHSHPPVGAYFSETDLRMAHLEDGETAAWPGVVYIVVGLKDSERGPRGVKAFAIEDGAAREIELEVV